MSRSPPPGSLTHVTRSTCINPFLRPPPGFLRQMAQCRNATNSITLCCGAKARLPAPRSRGENVINSEQTVPSLPDLHQGPLLPTKMMYSTRICWKPRKVAQTSCISTAEQAYVKAKLGRDLETNVLLPRTFSRVLTWGLVDFRRFGRCRRTAPRIGRSPGATCHRL